MSNAEQLSEDVGLKVVEPSAPESTEAPALDLNAGDYIVDRSGNITRIAEIDKEAGIVLTVWGRQLLFSELSQNGVTKFSPVLPSSTTIAAKVLDGSNTRTIIYEGITYRVENVIGDYVELSNVAGLFPRDIFTVMV